MVLTLEFQPEYEHLAYGESARLTFSAHMLAPAVEESGRSIVSLTSVLDKSGSMSGSKLDLVKVSQPCSQAQLTGSIRTLPRGRIIAMKLGWRTPTLPPLLPPSLPPSREKR